MSIVELEIENNIKNFFESFAAPYKKVVIFFQGYPSAQVVVPLLKDLNRREIDVELIVSSNDLYKFSEEYLKNYFKHIINISKPQSKSKSRLENYFNLALEKIKLYNYKRQIHYCTNANVLFFSRDFALREYCLLNYLKKQQSNSIYYFQLGKLGFVTLEVSLKSKILIFILRLIYGKDLSMVNRSNSISTRIKSDFFKGVKYCKAVPDDLKACYGITPSFITISENIKVMYFDQSWSTVGYLNRNKIDILEIINNKLKYKYMLGIKYHPGNENYDLSRYGQIIPSYIPAEFISVNNCKAVVSFASWTLSKAYIKNIPGISLLYLLNINDKVLESDYRNKMEIINKDLYFPKSLDEFSEILDNILSN